MTVVFDMHQTIYQSAPDCEKKIREMPGAIDTFLDFFDQGYKIVIISSSIIQHSRQVLQSLLEERDLPSERIKQIFNQIDILTMQYFGSKHDPDSWKQAMQPYQNIEYIFEDGEEKLKAAGQAAQDLGSSPELYQSIKEYLE
ncbi:MAG: hypothetical protein GF381_04005 [Candidatus Pacebacteria bacterium]|nr:hypothetical protein [Candidatus Paceibacterota bacterium]